MSKQIKKFDVNMFDRIKSALKKPEKTGGAFANIMRFPAGHTYTLRLIPNLDDNDKTFYHHILHQWTSKKDGSFISALSLKTSGERDPINDLRWKLYKEWKSTNPPKDEKFENPIKVKEGWLVNVYVVNDPANPENNGQVKILSLGPQLMNIVGDAIDGEGKDEFGAKIFDLGTGGCDLLIKAEEQGIFTTYKSSRFTTVSKLNLTDEEIGAVYEKVHDLEQLYTVRTPDELQSLINEHFFCEEEAPTERKSVSTRTQSETKPTTKSAKVTTPTREELPDEDDDIPMFHESDKPKNNVESIVDSLIADLDID